MTQDTIFHQRTQSRREADETARTIVAGDLQTQVREAARRDRTQRVQARREAAAAEQKQRAAVQRRREILMFLAVFAVVVAIFLTDHLLGG